MFFLSFVLLSVSSVSYFYRRVCTYMRFLHVCVRRPVSYCTQRARMCPYVRARAHELKHELAAYALLLSRGHGAHVRVHTCAYMHTFMRSAYAHAPIRELARAHELKHELQHALYNACECVTARVLQHTSTRVWRPHADGLGVCTGHGSVHRPVSYCACTNVQMCTRMCALVPATR